MDPLVLLFLLLIIVAGGGIGVLADSLGRKLGKKRLSIFKLRPKHVAQVGTFLAGMTTSLLTILLVFVLSSDVRQWIIEGRRAIVSSRVYKSQNDILEKRIAEKSNEVALLENKGSVAKTQLEEIQAQLAKAQLQYKAATLSADNAHKLIAQTQTSLTESKSILALRQKKLSLVQKALQDNRSQLASIEVSYKLQKGDLAGAYSRQHDLQKQQTDLEKQQQALSIEINQKKQQIESDTALLRQQNDQLAFSKDLLKKVQAQVAEEEDKVAVLQQKALDFQSVATNSRTQPLIFTKNEELARISVPAGLSNEEADAALQRVLRKARQVAADKGAKPKANDLYPAGLIKRNRGNITVTPEDEEQAIVAGLAHNPSETVLIAYSVLNAFKGEFVGLDIAGFSNPVIYKKGTTISELKLAKNMTREQVLTSLDDFLKTNVQKKALSDGMIPMEGRDDSILSITPEQTVDVVEKLTRNSRASRLFAITQSDTRAGDKLELNLIVR